MAECRIQVRKNGRAIGFLTPKGGTNKLKVHAALWSTRVAAEDQLTQLASDNEGYEFKIQEEN